jgi:superfamily I DNA and/or RNA helicase
MLPAIGDLISRCFYDGGLTSEPRDIPSWQSLVLPAPVTWFTTTQLEDRHERFNGTSYSNNCEARKIRQLLKRLDFAAKAAEVETLTVALLAAYTGQRNAIDRLIAEEEGRLEHLSVECNTVDAFQGREADVAIYSVTRSNPVGEIGFLREAARVNVALSRAKSGLIIVGDHAFCRSVAGANPLRVVLEHIEANRDSCALEAVNW